MVSLLTDDGPSPVTGSATQSPLWFIGAAGLIGLSGLVSGRRFGSQLESAVADDLRSVLAALAAFSILTLGFQLTVVGAFTDPSNPSSVRRPATWGRLTLLALACGTTAAALTFLAISSSLEFRLQISAASAIAITAMIIGVPARAVLLSGQQWRTIGLIGIVAVIPRLVVGWLLVDGSSLLPILGAVVAGELIATGLVLAVTADSERRGHWHPGTHRHLWTGVGGSIGLGVLLLLMSVTSRSRLGDGAGSYGQGASIARTVFLLVFTVAFVFFPAIANNSLGTVRLRRAFHAALLLSTAAAAVAVTAVMVAPGPLVTLVTTDQIESPATVRILTVAYAATGLAIVSLMQYVAHSSLMALLAWPFALPMLIGHVVATTATALALAALASAVALLAAVSLPALLRVQPVLRPDLVEHAQPQPDPPVTTGTTVVIPSYNPGPRVIGTIDGVVTAFEGADLEVRVIVVSDGSTDGSPELLDARADEQVTHLRHAANAGKGAALRTGLREARTPVVAFVDADGDLPPHQLTEMVRIQVETSADIVFGSKRHALSRVDIPRLRRFTSRIYQILIRLLFRLDISDTQTGIKVFARETVRDTLPVLHENGFALDLEMFVAARATGHAHFVEFPVELVRQGDSTISSRSVVRMLTDTLRIFWRAKVTLQYLRAAAAVNTVPTTLASATE